ncbi:unnamed protein product [Protopolystoma xenopodis]|uniref:Immunoglobulin I-set domain-containing protein n=1 Tax=Protopolystoma xenopodis TaxID=117903 RepID=A0A3S5AUN6_9PLAT|nr:unnamed protein product [Protopolystoma xenopodis]
MYLVAPALLKNVRLVDTYRIHAGQSFVVEVPFEACPKPSIRWQVNGVAVIPSSKRYHVDTVCGLTSLSVQRSQREDAGQVDVLIQNNYGSLNWVCELIILGERLCLREVA